MMTDKILSVRENIFRQKPLIHCITNPISITECANVILSVGAKPIMAEHPGEVCEITQSCDALMLNTGNITDARMESMILSLKSAKDNGIPSLLDIVGISCSKFRREYILKLLKTGIPNVIKGNYSEIASFSDPRYFSRGVDADSSLDMFNISNKAEELAAKYQTVIIATGPTDIVTDGAKTFYIENGTDKLSYITGTGCMLGALCCAFMTFACAIDASIYACSYFGICGELSETDKGNGSFMINLMDKISTVDKRDLNMHLKVKGKNI